MSGKIFHDIAGGLWRHKGLLAIVELPLFCVAFLVVEHLRGSILLARYIRTLSAQGERMTARDFLSPLPPGENGPPMLFHGPSPARCGLRPSVRWCWGRLR